MTDSRLVERYSDSRLKSQNASGEGNESDAASEDSDDILELLEDQDDNEAIAKYRAQRTQQLAQEFSRVKDAIRVTESQSRQVGAITEYHTEGELIADVTSGDSDQCSLVHFYEPQFQKCALMSERLAQVASKHLNLQVMQIKGTNAPFLVTKLKIKVLPCVVIYRNGVECDRLVGFEKLGGGADGFSFLQLEEYLYSRDMIRHTTITGSSVARQSQREQREESDDDY